MNYGDIARKLEERGFKPVTGAAVFQFAGTPTEYEDGHMADFLVILYPPSGRPLEPCVTVVQKEPEYDSLRADIILFGGDDLEGVDPEANVTDLFTYLGPVPDGPPRP